MSLKIRTALKNTELAKINRLAEECSTRDGTEYAPFTGGGNGSGPGTGADACFALFYRRRTLAGFAYLCMTEPPELSGLVLPGLRRRHIFTRMAKALLRRSNVSGCEFSGREKYPGFAECAASLGALRKHDEYLMRFTADAPPSCAAALSYATEYRGGETEFLFNCQGAPAGSLSLVREGNLVNICKVYVEPSLRGRGLGSAMLCEVLKLILKPGQKKPVRTETTASNDMTSGENTASDGLTSGENAVPDGLTSGKNSAPRIILQVSGENKPALALYTRCGFEIIDSVTFYSLP